MSYLTPEQFDRSTFEELEELFNLRVMEVATLHASGRVKRSVLPVDLIGESQSSRFRLDKPGSERELRHVEILASFIGVSPALAGVLEADGRRTVYVPVPPPVNLDRL